MATRTAAAISILRIRETIIHAPNKFVGRERRERVSQLARCGEGCFDSRRRVNSTGYAAFNLAGVQFKLSFEFVEATKMMRFKQLRCSFCRKKDSEVLKLVAGPRVYICDACVAIATEIMNDPPSNDNAPVVRLSMWRKVSLRVRRSIRGGHTQRIGFPSAS